MTQSANALAQEIQTPQQAIIALMYTMVWIDHQDHPSELKELLHIIRNVPVFEGFDDGECVAVAETMETHFAGVPSDHNDACTAVVLMAKQKIPSHLYETALSLVCDIAAADLEFHPNEPSFLGMIRKGFDIPPLYDHALRYASKVRKRRLIENPPIFEDAAR